MEKSTLQSALNEFSQGTTSNIDSIMIKDANGKQYWMKKADLAEVLGGLLSTLKLYPYMYRGIAGDLDKTKENGFWMITNENSTNIPEGTFRYGILEVEKTDKYIIQKFYPTAKGSSPKFGLFIRTFYEIGWGSWNYLPYN